ncbi:hypothetical protein C0Q70_19208 [Pomacea canaliculata]|uniref:Uncharacterized protein n=1 Tax=Pomacea canaliculata TaxID=400727 RepID=A0A2T7NIR1_POMCA|nr:hypothetical protein C0Q70_19208 [Pomacea canaliculata]
MEETCAHVLEDPLRVTSACDPTVTPTDTVAPPLLLVLRLRALVWRTAGPQQTVPKGSQEAMQTTRQTDRTHRPTHGQT